MSRTVAAHLPDFCRRGLGRPRSSLEPNPGSRRSRRPLDQCLRSVRGFPSRSDARRAASTLATTLADGGIILSRASPPPTASSHSRANCVQFAPNLDGDPGPLSDQRVRLPIDEHLPRIAREVSTHRGLVLTAEPGAGKSTRIPPFLLETLYGDRSERVVVVQPRRIAAAVRRISNRRGTRMDARPRSRLPRSLRPPGRRPDATRRRDRGDSASPPAGRSVPERCLLGVFSMNSMSAAWRRIFSSLCFATCGATLVKTSQSSCCRRR